MLATIILDGGWEIVFYLMIIELVISVVFIDLPQILNKILDWFIKKRNKNTDIDNK